MFGMLTFIIQKLKTNMIAKYMNHFIISTPDNRPRSANNAH